ncbi:MAG: hypothetical protein FJ286_01630 [Planctomycetes bacterium]|nr:hypothetical protein [Planctomycetota bacterium]
MPTSIEQIQTFLDEYSLNYRVDEEHDAILIGFGLNPESTTFRDVDGDPGIQFVIRVLERGEFLAIFTPQAWNVEDCPHRAAVFEAIASIQTQYKMLRFDYDPSDGEIRPNVELPLEDSELTSRQFHRLMHGMLHGVPRFDRVIRHAIERGEVSFAGLDDEEPTGAPPPRIARLQRLAEEAGGIEALERLACGGDEPEAESPATESRDAVGDDGSAAPQDHSAPTALQPSVPPAKPTIQRLWDHLFGSSDRGPGTDRKAG